MSKLDTNHVVNLDLVKDRVNSVIKFGLADVETSDFFVGLYNNGSRIFDKDYIVTLYIVKPNGTFRNIKLEPKEGLKKYYCNLPDTLKNIPGEYLCQAIIFDNLANEKKISKSKFKYSVDLDLASEMAGIIDEEEQESILTNILNRLLTLENPVEPYATQKHVDECVSTLTEEIDTIKVKDVEQDGRLVNIESKNTEQDERLDAVESKNVNQDNRLDIIEAKDIEQDNRLVNIETRNTEQDNRLNIIESKDIEQDGRLNTLENKVDGIDEKIVGTIEPTLANHGNRVDTLENKDLVHESRMTDIESKNVEQDNRLDALEVKDIAHESRMVNIETKNTEQDNRLNSLESKDLIHESRLTNIESKNTEQDERLNNVESKNIEQDNRLGIAENRLANIGNDITNTMQPIIDEHTSRLDAIEAKNQQQDDRLLDIEKVNKQQAVDIKCLYGASQTMDITEEGNSIYLQNSNNGFAIIDEIQGNTMVNCNKEPDKEIILNGNINTQGYSNVTLTEGVDGGLVDVALEGNTMVNVCDQKDPIAVTKGYTVETGNHVALQGEYDGKCRPVVTGNTLWIDNDTEEVLTAFDETKNLRLQSSFEDKVVTQEMVDSGEEEAENLGKYKVDYVVTGKNKFDKSKGLTDNVYTYYIPCQPNTSYIVNTEGTAIWFYDTNKKNLGYTINSTPSPANARYLRKRLGDTIDEVSAKIDTLQIEEGNVVTDYEPYKEYKKTFYLNSPLLEGDTIEQQGDNVVHVHRYGKLVLDGRPTGGTDVINGVNYYYVGNVSSSLNDASCMCDKYLGTSAKGAGSLDKCIYVHNNSKVYIKDSSYSDLDTLKTWLQSNPVTVVYKLYVPQYEVISQNDTILCDSYINGHLDVDSVVPIEKVIFNETPRMTLKYLYPSTNYIVQFEADNVGSAGIVVGGKNISTQTVAKGINKFNATTSETPNTQLKIEGIGFNASNIVVTEATDQDFGYFEGMKSVGECEDLEVVSSNLDDTLSNTQTLTHEPLRAVGDIKDKYVLIDGKWYIERNCGVRAYQEGDIDNYITDMINTVYPLQTPQYEPIDYNPFEVYSGITHISNNSTIPCNMTIKNTGYNCLLKPSTTYTVSSNLGLNVITTPTTLTEDCLRFYDTDTSDVTTMRDVLVLEGDWTTKADLIPANFSGIESAFEQEYDEAVGKYKVKIRVQNEDASKENYIEFYIDEPLRGIGNVKDKVYVKDDKVVVERNCGSATFDGSDDEGWYNYNGCDNVYVNDSITDKKIGYGTSMCDLFTNTNNSNLFDENKLQHLSYTDHPRLITMYFDYLIGNINEFKQWLQQNPITVVYQLAKPTYEEVEYNDVKLCIESFKNSTLFYNSNVPVTSTVHYSYSVPIVDTVAQTASISNEQDSMIIDLATQCAVMEMYLM